MSPASNPWCGCGMVAKGIKRTSAIWAWHVPFASPAEFSDPLLRKKVPSIPGRIWEVGGGAAGRGQQTDGAPGGLLAAGQSLAAAAAQDRCRRPTMLRFSFFEGTPQ